MPLQVFQSDGSLKVVYRAVVTEIDFSNPIVGILPLENGGTEADLSATGPGVVQQATLGAPLSIVAVTGTGNVVKATSPTIVTPTIAKLANLTTNGFVKTSSGDGTLVVDTNTYLTGNQTITLSGDITGSGATAITTTYNGVLPLAKLTDGATAGIPLVAGGGAGDPNYAALNLAQATAITGILPVAKGGTGSDLSAAGAGFIKQASSGAVVTISAVDLSTGDATGVLAAGRFPALTGDVTTVAGALATTLATVNSNVGSFGIATITVNAKGLVTAASATATTGSGSVVLASGPTLVSPVINTGVSGSAIDTDVTLAANSDTLLASQKAIKSYVDSVASGLSVKQSVVAASAAALPANTYSNGASGVGATLTGIATGVLIIDGVTIALNDRVLIKDEAAPANNGIYKCTLAGAIGVAYVLTRTTDTDTSAEIDGAFVFVENGTVNVGSGWVCANASALVIGTTAITFTQFSGAGEITAGTGLSKSGNTLSIDSTVVTLAGSQVLTNKTLTTPTIASFTNATHTHLNAAGGGTLDGAAIGSGDIAVARIATALTTPGPIGGTTASTATFSAVTVNMGTASAGAVGLGVRSGTLTSFRVTPNASSGLGLLTIINPFDQIMIALRAVSGQTVNIQEWQTSAATTVASIGSVGAASFTPVDTTTNGNTTALTIGHFLTTANAGANNIATRLEFKLADSTSAIGAGVVAGAMNVKLVSATHASYTSQMDLTVTDASATRTVISIGANNTAGVLSFYGGTPIAQPTTAIAGATLVSNGGTTITSTDTFDGYTIAQMAKVIRNLGLAA